MIRPFDSVLRSRSSHRGRRRGTQDHSEQLVIAEFNPSETQDPMEKESRPRPRIRPRQRPSSTRLDCAVSRLACRSR